MKLSELAKKPQLVKIVMEDEDTVKEYGEPLEFYTWDRQPMDVFLKLAAIDQRDSNSIIEAVRNLILDENGKPVIDGEVTLPTRIMMRVITTVVEQMGKF